MLQEMMHKKAGNSWKKICYSITSWLQHHWHMLSSKNYLCLIEQYKHKNMTGKFAYTRYLNSLEWSNELNWNWDSSELLHINQFNVNLSIHIATCCKLIYEHLRICNSPENYILTKRIVQYWLIRKTDYFQVLAYILFYIVWSPFSQ